jgi:hypothetical protein
MMLQFYYIGLGICGEMRRSRFFSVGKQRLSRSLGPIRYLGTAVAGLSVERRLRLEMGKPAGFS